MANPYLIGGIGQGIGNVGNMIAQMLMLKFQAEQDKEMKDVKLELLKLKQQEAKRDQKIAEQVGPLLQRFQQFRIGKQAGIEAEGETIPGAATSLLPEQTTVTPQQSFSDIASRLDLLSQLGPYSGIIERATGMNPQAMFENRMDIAQFQQRGLQDAIRNLQRERELGMQRERMEGARDLVEVPTEGGGRAKVPVPRYGMPGAIQTQRPAANMPISETNLPLWIHPETLESPGFGTTPQQAEKSGYKRVSTSDKNKINDFRSVNVLVDRIYKLMGNVFPETETFTGRVFGGVERTLGAMLQTNPNAALLKSLLDGTQAALVRMFEKGTLTDQDIKRARKLNIELTDRADVAWDKIENMREFIRDLQSAFVSGKVGNRKSEQRETEEPDIVNDIDSFLKNKELK